MIIHIVPVNHKTRVYTGMNNNKPKHIGKTVHTIITDKLREQILSGEILPGTKLTINEIAEKYSVSQMPVRQAFQSLEGERLLESSPYKGARVMMIDVDFVKDIYDLRSGLESLMGRLSMNNFNEESISGLEQITDKMQKASENDNIELFINLNISFHRTINEKSENMEAMDVYARYSNLIKALRSQYGYNRVRFSKSIDEHRKIIELLKNKDLPGLNIAFVKHGEGARDILIESMGKDRENT